MTDDYVTDRPARPGPRPITSSSETFLEFRFPALFVREPRDPLADPRDGKTSDPIVEF